MKQQPIYTEYHPKWYRTRVSTYWWFFRWAYLKFILRELSSIFVAYFVLIILLQLNALAKGPEAYADFQEWLKSPLLIALNGISFLFLLYHTITWFNAAPRAMALYLGGKRVTDLMIALPNYIAWLVISAVLAWIIMGG